MARLGARRAVEEVRKAAWPHDAHDVAHFDAMDSLGKCVWGIGASKA